MDDSFDRLIDITKGRAVPFAHSHYTHEIYDLPWSENVCAPLQSKCDGFALLRATNAGAKASKDPAEGAP